MTPLVSVVTPVYNGGKYLTQCIESVLSQTYQHWVYTIVNNASTDKTLDIALGYAARDSRIRVVSNQRLAGVIENHNIAFRHIDGQSTYTKVVSADDWLYPECIEAMVCLAERYPCVGIVQGLVVNIYGVRWTGITSGCDVINGREACRLYLLGKLQFGGQPSSLLYRSEIVRCADPFFPGSNPNADAEACLRTLQRWDLGVVGRVLSYERIHAEAVTARAVRLGRHLPDALDVLCTYGPAFLSHDELRSRVEEALNEYYEWLAAGVVHLRGPRFWKYHAARMAGLGFPVDEPRLANAVVRKLLDLLGHPGRTLSKITRRVAHARVESAGALSTGSCKQCS